MKEESILSAQSNAENLKFWWCPSFAWLPVPAPSYFFPKWDSNHPVPTPRTKFIANSAPKGWSSSDWIFHAVNAEANLSGPDNVPFGFLKQNEAEWKDI